MRTIVLLLAFLLSLTGCSSYKTQYVSFRPPEAYNNHLQQDGISLGGEAFSEKKVAKKAFGFDIRGAGLLPVMIVLDNKSGGTLELVTAQSFLVDYGGNYWPMVANNVAMERLESSTQVAKIMGGAGKGAAWGAVAGTVIGAAVGIVAGHSVGEAVGKGAAVGAASGAVMGGGSKAASTDDSYRILDDLREKGLEGKGIPDQYLANGFLFFPGEAKSAKELRLQWRDRGTGKVHRSVLQLEQAGKR
ncbi:glycine zipper family protein [Geomonas sp. RF6]|uniref:glycine zipper family protein n=1 Tax=Geomonas sp. RF6 TaxID=2897342 RepID=UPI001E467038|nr:glycine zipper family protein [Geomonas sp. RF6]UFS71927.1 glycine zipper family protein [Geomonas sp. RF6]